MGNGFPGARMRHPMFYGGSDAAVHPRSASDSAKANAMALFCFALTLVCFALALLCFGFALLCFGFGFALLCFGYALTLAGHGCHALVGSVLGTHPTLTLFCFAFALLCFALLGFALLSVCFALRWLCFGFALLRFALLCLASASGLLARYLNTPGIPVVAPTPQGT